MMANRIIKSQKGIITTNLNDALNMFNKMLQKQPLPSPVKFTNLLDHVTNMKHFSHSIRLFKQMCALGVPYNEETINIVVKCYSQLNSTKLGFTVLGYCFKRGGVVPNVLAYNTILNGFVLEDQTHHAETLFKKLFVSNNVCEPNLVTYNTVIKGLCKTGNNFTSVALLRLMDGRGCSPNDVSYKTVIHGLCNDLLIDDAFKLFKEMVFKRNISPNVNTYNSLMYALSKLGRWDDVSTMLKQMEDENISPNVKTFNILVDALCKQGKVKEAQVVIGMMVESGKYPPDVQTYNSLIHGYTLQGEMSKAKTIFDSLAFRGVKPNVDTYNELLNGYQKNLKKKEAFRLFHDLTRKTSKNKHNLLPNYVTVYIMLLLGPMSPAKRSSSATQLTFPDEVHYKCHLQHTGDDYEDALGLFHFMDGSKLNSNIDVYNIVIDVVSKCKKFDISRRLYRDLFVKGLRPDVETYAVMISGLCRGGLLKDAKQLFLKMKKSDCQPNSVIFNDLIQGYLKNKSIHDVSRLIEELKEERNQSYIPTASTVSLLMDQTIARFPGYTLLKLMRQLMPNDWNNCPPHIVIYNDFSEGFYKNKPFDEVSSMVEDMVEHQLDLHLTPSTVSLLIDQMIAKYPGNSLLKLIRQIVPKEWSDVPDTCTKYDNVVEEMKIRAKSKKKLEKLRF